MPNIKLRRKTSVGYDDLYPQTDWSLVLNKPTTFTPTAHTHGQISDTGAITAAVVTPANTDTIVITDTSDSGILKRGITIGTDTATFLRNDGTWASPSGVDNYVNITGDTMTGNLTISNTQPTFKLNDTTSGADDFFLYGDNNRFFVSTDRDDSGGSETPNPLELNNTLAIGLVYGNEILTSGSTLPSHTHSATDITSGTLDAARLPSDISGLTLLHTGSPTLVTAGTATWTDFALGYTPAVGDKFLVVVSAGSSSTSIEKAGCIVEYGTFSSTTGMSLVGFMGYGGISGGAVVGVNYGAQWQISSSNFRLRYPAQSAWNSTTLSQITTFYVWAIYKVN
jgi:hypothetical protein